MREVRELLGAPSSPQRTTAVISWFYTPEWDGSVRDSTILGDPNPTREGLRGHRRVSNGHDACHKLPRITAPTLVLHGSDDPMTPVENAHLLADRIPNAQLHVHAGGRHGFFDEFSADLAPLLRGFLDS